MKSKFFKRLEYVSKINCRSKDSKYKSGRKITGMVFTPLNELLVTEGDNDVRLYLRDVFHSLGKYIHTIYKIH